VARVRRPDVLVATKAGRRLPAQTVEGLPPGATRAQFALRWILMYEAVTVAIPGCRTPAQAAENFAAAALPALDGATMDACRDVYDQHIRIHVHHRW
jgi:aryl-alcohol dehydrogenase-like predicted oxidoreductase